MRGLKCEDYKCIEIKCVEEWMWMEKRTNEDVMYCLDGDAEGAGARGCERM